ADVLGGGAEGAPPLAVPYEDPLAAPCAHARPDRVDLAGAVTVRNDERRAQGAPRAAAAHLPVRGIHTRGVQAHPHLARAGRGCRLLADLEHLFRGTLFAIERSAHARLLMVGHELPLLRVRSAWRGGPSGAHSGPCPRPEDRRACPDRRSGA